MDFSNAKSLRFLANCVRFRVLKRLEEEEGGVVVVVVVVVIDFVRNAMRPKHLLQKSDRFIYVYICMYILCICVCVCKREFVS